MNNSGEEAAVSRSGEVHDFSAYKRSTIWRRIERRMSLHHLREIDDYVRYLRDYPQELDLLFNEMLIGVTSFFRDEGIWERLRNEVFPELIARQPDGGTLRAWVDDCSTGEEASSLAIVFQEALALSKAPQRVSLQIFAPDLDRDATAFAGAAEEGNPVTRRALVCSADHSLSHQGKHDRRAGHHVSRCKRSPQARLGIG